MAVSFESQIAPIFNKYQPNMSWRFDLTSYDDMKASATLIGQRIQGIGGMMPPPDYPPLTDDQIALFLQWIEDGCQP